MKWSSLKKTERSVLVQSINQKSEINRLDFGHRLKSEQFDNRTKRVRIWDVYCISFIPYLIKILECDLF